MKRQELDLTQGPILGRLLRFALPMMAGNLFQQLYNIADTLIVGRCIGADALAAVGSAYTLMVFLTSVLIGLCMGSGAILSEDRGAGDDAALRRDIALSGRFIAAVTVVLWALICLFLDPILRLLRIPAEVMPVMRQYTRVVFLGLGFVGAYNFFAYLLRSVGNSAVPFRVLAAASVMNVLLDLLFVAVLHLGAASAAAATVLSQAFSAGAVLLYTVRHYPELLARGQQRIRDAARMAYIIRNDLLTCLQQSVMNFGILMIQSLVNSFGPAVMAAFAAAVKIDTIAYMPAQEFGNAYSLFISHNHGAAKPDRIEKGTRRAAAATVVFCAAVSLTVWLAAGPLMGLFIKSGTPSAEQILACGVQYLHIEGACYFGIGLLFLFYAYFRGIGRPGVSLLLTVISLGTRVLLSYTLAPNTPLGVTAVWWSIPIGWILADAAGLVFWKRSRKNGTM